MQGKKISKLFRLDTGKIFAEMGGVMTEHTPGPWKPPPEEEWPEHCEGGPHPCTNPDAQWRRQYTYYPNDESNWMYLCEECQAEVDAYWEACWEEYNASRL